MSSKPDSTAEEVWNASNLHFQYAPERIREFYTGALKYLLPQSAWDDSFPALPRTLEDHEIMVFFLRGFNEQNRKRMLAHATDWDDLMRLAAIGKCSPLKKMNHRIRKRKLEALRLRIRRYLKTYFGNRQKPWHRGERLATTTLHRHYFSPPAQPQSQVA